MRLFPSLLLLSPATVAWPTGARGCRASGCTDSQWQEGYSEILMRTDRGEAAGGDLVTVTIESTRQKDLRGLLLFATDAPDGVRPVGEFVRGEDFGYEEGAWQFGPCGASSLTQRDGEAKSLPYSFIWRAPANFRGMAIFRAVAVRGFDEWTSVTAGPVRPGSPGSRRGGDSSGSHDGGGRCALAAAAASVLLSWLSACRSV